MATVEQSDTGVERHAASVGLDPRRIPRHIAIIMDGNGRWAKQRGLPRIAGHRRGTHSVRSVVEECCRLGIGQLTLYCLSSENWKRPRHELDQLMLLLERYLVDERETLQRQNVRLQVIGRRDQLPAGVLREMQRSLDESAGNTGTTLCLAIDYGGRQELVHAARRLAERVAAGELDAGAIDADALESELYTAGMPEPDLLIRTAGEMRLSNFLLWQVSYAEIFVTDVCWPEFDEQSLHTALRAYAGRERRYGGLNS